MISPQFVVNESVEKILEIKENHKFEKSAAETYFLAALHTQESVAADDATARFTTDDVATATDHSASYVPAAIVVLAEIAR
jgi:hypothetical protein